MAELRVDWTRDEIILACDLVSKNQWRGLEPHSPEVVELSQLLIKNPLHPPEVRGPKFRNPNGVSRKTWDIATQHPLYKGKSTKGNKLDLVVLESFIQDEDRWHSVAQQIRQEIESSESASPTIVELDFDETAEEGRLLLARHYRRERSPRLRKLKLESYKKQGLPIQCDVCAFNFGDAYGARGSDYIEVHHVLPLHVSAQTTTSLKDLVLVCANCHRMIHRGDWITPSDLQKLIATAGAERRQGIPGR